MFSDVSNILKNKVLQKGQKCLEKLLQNVSDNQH